MVNQHQIIYLHKTFTLLHYKYNKSSVYGEQKVKKRNIEDFTPGHNNKKKTKTITKQDILEKEII